LIREETLPLTPESTCNQAYEDGIETPAVNGSNSDKIPGNRSLWNKKLVLIKLVVNVKEYYLDTKSAKETEKDMR